MIMFEQIHLIIASNIEKYWIAKEWDQHDTNIIYVCGVSNHSGTASLSVGHYYATVKCLHLYEISDTHVEREYIWRNFEKDAV